MRLALDAMGSDNAPGVEVEGAIQASKEIDAEIILVGQKPVLEKELAKHPKVSNKIIIQHASEVVQMIHPSWSALGWSKKGKPTPLFPRGTAAR